MLRFPSDVSGCWRTDHVYHQHEAQHLLSKILEDGLKPNTPSEPSKSYLARQNDRLSAERKALSKKMRIRKAAARLDEITRRFHIAIALLAVGGTLPMFVLTGRSRIEDLPILFFAFA
ncbi:MULTISPECIES: hypothetical protein [unclassified Neorhizobium]|uniref:hypothetical protein n=1 Tax=unclassified Neorhizobium TaxID=2629175 RepID=UPI001FF4F563|nr:MULTISPECIES: hypothetical protein [unclassified Neorhizobium]MCJ9669014.1 hypothetical protein [Neorhizobium sp. SHOUNA12B]MCJ9744968.1 hypothetical protein [Neorhizobium sp. SHOUNA12A]